MTTEDIENILRVQLMGEMQGFGQALSLMQECIVHCDGKNYVYGDKLMGLIRDRKKLLIDRFERGRNF